MLIMQFFTILMLKKMLRLRQLRIFLFPWNRDLIFYFNYWNSIHKIKRSIVNQENAISKINSVRILNKVYLAACFHFTYKNI